MATDLTMQQREDRAKQQYEDHEKALQKIKEFTSCGRVVEFAMDFNARMKGAAVHFAEQSIRAERERDKAYTALDNIRDAVLNERYQLEGSGCTNYQINDVLGIIDDNDPRVALPANGGQHND